LYGVLAGAGCSHGVPTVPNGIFRVGPGNTWTLMANLSAFIQAHPVAHPNPPDFEPDGTWYSLLAAKGALYTVEPNHGEVDRVNPSSGAISRLVDVSAHYGHNVPTAIARHGVFYLGNLGLFSPADQAGDEHVYQLNPNGRIRIRASGLEKVLALAFHGGKLYALEMSTSAHGPVPGTGAIVRVRAGEYARAGAAPGRCPEWGHRSARAPVRYPSVTRRIAMWTEGGDALSGARSLHARPRPR
jgi:hypothetical protein